MFGFNLLLIATAAPEAYGHFILIFALYFLAFGVQNAVVLMPINVLLPGRSDDRQRATLRMLSTIDLGVVAGLVIAVTALAALLQLSPALCLGGALLVITASARELARTILVTLQKPKQLIWLDGVATATSLVALTVLWSHLRPEEAVMYALVVGNLLAVVVLGPTTYRRPTRLMRSCARYRGYWQKSRWALIGAGLTEGQQRLYIFVVELARGSTALGVIHAGRVLVNPISTLAFAWARATRPMIAHQIVDGDHNGAFRTIFTGFIFLAAFGVAYASALLLAWPYIEPHVAAARGEEFRGLLILWSILALVNLPAICLSNYLLANHRYRSLTLVGAISMATSSLLLIWLFFGVDLSWAVIALIIGEAVMVTGLLTLVWRELPKRRDTAHAVNV